VVVELWRVRRVRLVRLRSGAARCSHAAARRSLCGARLRRVTPPSHGNPAPVARVVPRRRRPQFCACASLARRGGHLWSCVIQTVILDVLDCRLDYNLGLL